MAEDEIMQLHWKLLGTRVGFAVVRKANGLWWSFVTIHGYRLAHGHESFAEAFATAHSAASVRWWA